MSDQEPMDHDLEAFAERLDRAFASTTPRPAFRTDLLMRLQRRQRWPRVDVAQLGGIAAVFVVVVAAGFLLLHMPHGGGGSAGSSSAEQPAVGGAASQRGASTALAPNAAWGALPRPQVAPHPNGAAAGSVTATLTLPPTAVVQRYTEPTQQDADGFANRVNAKRAATPGNPNSFGLYSGSGFALSIYPTNSPQGIEPSFVLTPKGSEPNGSGPDPATAQSIAQQFLDQFQLTVPPQSRIDVAVTPNAPTVVRFTALVGGHDQVATDGTRLGLVVVVKADSTVFQASGPLPTLNFESSLYPLAPFADLARLAAGATAATLDKAELVYVLAFDGQHGYLEPAVLFTGSGASVLVPAVAPNQLR